jgi:hypothetical protein
MNHAPPEVSPPGVPPAPQRIHVPDHLVRCLIITTGFPFTGWLALRHSWRVNHRLAEGDLEGARRECRLALKWYWISAGLLILLLLGAAVVLFIQAFPNDLDSAL